MVDTERFHLGPHAVQAVGGIVTSMGRDRETHALEIATHIPLDIESIARILDALEDEGIVAARIDERGLKHITLKRDDYADVAERVRTGTHLDDPGLKRNLVALRADDNWVRNVRDQHRVLRAITSLGHKTDLDRIVAASDVPASRVRTMLGDLETEGYAISTYDEAEDVMNIEFPPLAYPKELFERNLAIIAHVETERAAVSPFIWLLLLLATLLLALFIVSAFVV